MNRKVDLGTFFSAIKEDVTELINTRWELLKLDFFEKTSLAASAIIFGIIIVNIIFFTLLFAFVALGFVFSDWVGSYAGGFGLVVALYLLILGIVLLFRKPIFSGFGNMILNQLDPQLERDLKQKEMMEEQIRRENERRKRAEEAKAKSSGRFSEMICVEPEEDILERESYE